MPDISIPGITESKYKTDTIIAGLVKAKEIQLDRMQEDRKKFELKRDVWQSINILTNKLEGSARALYSVDSPFRQKLTTSSNESVLTADVNRQAESGEYTVRVLQIAGIDSLRSNDITNDFQISSGKYTFGSGDERKSFTFNGGSLKQFVTLANRQLRGLAQFNIVNSRDSNQVLIFSSANGGAENQLEFHDLGRQLAIDTGLILDASSLQISLLQESLISPFNKISNYSLSESKNEVSIGPGQELRISLPNSYTVRSGSVMRYSIQAPKDDLPPISNTSDNRERQPEPPKQDKPQLPTSSDVKSGILRFSSRDTSDIPPPPSVEFENIRIDSASSETAFIGIDPSASIKADDQSDKSAQQQAISSQNTNNSQASQLAQSQQSALRLSEDGSDWLNPTANFYLIEQGRRVAAGPKEGEVQATTVAHEEVLSLDSVNGLRNIGEVVIRNPNPDREIVVRNLRFENIGIKDDYLPAHPISTAQNAKISYLGVETERPDNKVDDLLPGVTLNLKQAKPDEDITIRIEPDYDMITQRVAEFVSSFNDLMTQLNVVSSSNDIVIQEKTSFTEKQQEEARKVLGLMRGDSGIKNLQYQLSKSVSDGYPTILGTRVLAEVGISTNLTGFAGGIDQSKLRGYLEFDTETLQKAMKKNFVMVQDLFGRDNDGDFIVDSGGALEVQRVSNSYTLPNGPIPHRITDLDGSIADSDRQIANYKDYLVDYKVGLKRKYGRMEGALNQLNQQQQSLQNFSDSMNK